MLGRITRSAIASLPGFSPCTIISARPGLDEPPLASLPCAPYYAILPQNLHRPIQRQRLHRVAVSSHARRTEKRIVDRFFSSLDHRQEQRRHRVVQNQHAPVSRTKSDGVIAAAV